MKQMFLRKSEDGDKKKQKNDGDTPTSLRSNIVVEDNHAKGWEL
eukprot:CAMPEP_0206503442 /NCGR_PEP_ID=MMETSP0324_2-20121206/54725_1 /ASSEMBLY_ACC=CAM_ASM_000836 /TAXON_ID=2866 /ORGANISM="Crypthecodinium cohnii, Strain Seligo" /LENGTH=43 /DNA_ID= /DNA_START= /DNA_END= /DNA_ORIENTATION=